MAKSREHHSRNISGEDMIDDECTSRNVSVVTKTAGIEEDKEVDAQGAMVPQLHHSIPSYILTLDKKLKIRHMIRPSTTSYETRIKVQRT